MDPTKPNLPKPSTQRYQEAVDRWRGGDRESKPYPGEFGLQGVSQSPMHRTAPAEKVELKPHQQSGVNFIVAHNGQGILAHATGSGKTITGVKAVDKLLELGRAKKVVAITPSGLRTNFLVEGVHRASEHKGSILVGSGERGPGLYSWQHPDPESTYHIVSYEQFREHPEEIIKNTGADTLILDEFHRIKDPDRSTFQRLEEVRPLVKNVIGLTGSIVSTHPSNILQPIRAVTGGLHGLGTAEEFEERYLQRAEDPRAKKRPVVFSQPSTWLNWLRPPVSSKKRKSEFVGWKNVDELRRQLHQHIHYVGPELVADKMPEKHVETVRVEMSPLQERVYRAALKELPAPLLRKVHHGQPLAEGESAEVFNRLVKARQAANGVHALTGLTPEEAAPATPKLQKMLDDIEDHLHQTPDGGVIVYTNLVHGGADIIRAGLKQRGIEHGLFMGKGNEGVTEESRQQDVRDFKAGKKKVILITGAGNEGVSLPNATMHAAYDAHFNPEKILQSEARGWRLGGQSHRPADQRRVVVKRYMTVWPESRSLLGKVQAYFKNQEASDAVDEFLYRTADRRHNLNAQLHDILKDQQPEPHSLFSREQGLDTPAVTRHVPTPQVRQPVEPAQAPSAVPPAGPWWQRWKAASALPEIGETIPVKKDEELVSPFWSLAEWPGHINPGDNEPYDVVILSENPEDVPEHVRVVGLVPSSWDPKILAVAESVSEARARQMLKGFDYVRKALQGRQPTKKASIDAQIGLRGMEPQISPEDVRGQPIKPPAKSPYANWVKPPRILNPGVLEDVDDHTQQVRELNWWMNKEPGLKAASILAAAVDGALKEALADEGGRTLSVVVNADEPTTKEAFRRGGSLSPIVHVGLDSGHVDELKRTLRSRFTGLTDSPGRPHVTLLYAQGFKDPAHPALVGRVTKSLERKKLSFELTRLGTFNNHGKGVIYLKAEGKDLHDTHAELKQHALAHGGRMTHPTYQPHLTLFYRDKEFTPQERDWISQVPVSRMRVERDRTHIDVSVKHGEGWRKLAEETMEPGWLETAVGLVKEALTRFVPETSTIDVPQSGTIESFRLGLPPGASYIASGRLAEKVAAVLRGLPEVEKVEHRISKEASFCLWGTLREPQGLGDFCAKVSEALAPVLQAETGTTLQLKAAEDAAPKPRRWVEPKYRRPACQALNQVEDQTRITIDYPQQPCASGDHPSLRF